MSTLTKYTWETGSHYDEMDEKEYEPLGTELEWKIFDSFSYSPQGITSVERKPDNSLQVPVYEVFNGVKWAYDWPNNSSAVTWCVVNDEACKPAYVLKLRSYNRRNGYPAGCEYYQRDKYDRGNAHIFRTQQEVFDVIAKRKEEEELDPTPYLDLEMIPIMLSEYEYKYQRVLFPTMLAGKGLK